MYIAAPPIQASRLCGARTAPSVVCMPFMSLLSALIICEDADQQRHMRWHATACRWSCAESTNPRHDNEDLARADGVRIDCERATAAQDSRVREDNSLPRKTLCASQFDRNLRITAACSYNHLFATHRKISLAVLCTGPKRLLYELKEIEKKPREAKALAL